MPITLIASNCPAPVPPQTAIWLADAYDGTSNPPQSYAQLTGDTNQPVAAKLNANAAAYDQNTRYGSGGFGIGVGLVITAGTGLTVNVSAGQAMIDGIVDFKAAQVVAVSPSITRGYVYLKQDGTFQVVNNSLTLPSANCVFIGSFVSDGSGVTSVDTSGVISFKGGNLWRETADVECPTDTPTSGWSGFTKTLKGRWFWDGARYYPLQEQFGRLSISIAGGAGDTTLTASQSRNRTLELTGAITGNRNVVVATTDNTEFVVFNNSTGAFTVTVKTSGGTGIVVATGKTAILRCDGTNILRVTADNP